MPEARFRTGQQVKLLSVDRAEVPEELVGKVGIVRRVARWSGDPTGQEYTYKVEVGLDGGNGSFIGYFREFRLALPNGTVPAANPSLNERHQCDPDNPVCPECSTKVPTPHISCICKGCGFIWQPKDV